MNSGNGLDLFISISLSYPELNAVRYETNQCIIGLEIALQGGILPAEEQMFTAYASQCLNIYYRLQKIKPVVSKVYFKTLGEITLLNFERDIKSMSEGEIELILNLAKDYFPNRIIYDLGESIAEEPLKNKLKQRLLRRMSQDEDKHHFLAFRKQGKVLVYQK